MCSCEQHESSGIGRGTTAAHGAVASSLQVQTDAPAARAPGLVSSAFHGTVLALAFVLDAGGRSDTKKG